MAEPFPMQGVIPYLAMGGRARDAMDFYIRTFAAEDAGRMARPDGEPGLMHAQVSINGGMPMLTNHMGGTAPSVNFGHLLLVVADGQGWWDRGIDAGCAVVVPYEQQFWGNDRGLLQDPFGIKWAIMQTGAQSAQAAGALDGEAAA